MKHLELIEKLRAKIEELESENESLGWQYEELMKRREEVRVLKDGFNKLYEEIDISSYDFGAVNMMTSVKRILGLQNLPEIKKAMEVK